MNLVASCLGVASLHRFTRRCLCPSPTRDVYVNSSLRKVWQLTRRIRIAPHASMGIGNISRYWARHMRVCVCLFLGIWNIFCDSTQEFLMQSPVNLWLCYILISQFSSILTCSCCHGHGQNARQWGNERTETKTTTTATTATNATNRVHVQSGEFASRLSATSS